MSWPLAGQMRASPSPCPLVTQSQSLSTCRSQPIVESDRLLFSQAAPDMFLFPQYTALFIYSPDSAWSGERTHKEEEEGWEVGCCRRGGSKLGSCSIADHVALQVWPSHHPV